MTVSKCSTGIEHNYGSVVTPPNFLLDYVDTQIIEWFKSAF